LTSVVIKNKKKEIKETAAAAAAAQEKGDREASSRRRRGGSKPSCKEADWVTKSPVRHKLYRVLLTLLSVASRVGS
jgi:hypothetical protein